MANIFARLWRGDIALARAFWEFAILYGLIANVVATGAAFAVIASNLPAWLAPVLFLLPAPYNVLAAVGVWRSAGRYAGPRHWAVSARIGAIAWAVAMTLL